MPTPRRAPKLRRLVRLAHAAALAAFAAALLLTPRAGADPRTSYLVEQLKNEDYRVRTQAALALGASKDDAAVKPLCGALGDKSASVKAAAAAALGKLGKPAGAPCLKAALGREASASVKAQIEKSLAQLDGGGSSIGPDTKYYVAIQVQNKTSRPTGEIEALVRGTMTSKLLARRGVAVAPKSEARSKATSLIKSKNLKGFLLLATVEAPVYSGGNLTQLVRVTLMTYPGKSLQGEFTPKLTQSGTPSTDAESETLLMKMCVENAVETFHKIAPTL